MFADYSIKKPRKSTIYEALIVAGVGPEPTTSGLWILFMGVSQNCKRLQIADN